MRGLETNWEGWLPLWLTWMRAGGITEGSVKLRRTQIRRLARWCGERGPEDVGADDVVAWLGQYGWSAETIRSHRAAARSFYGWAAATGRCETNPAAMLPRVKPGRHRPRPAADAAITLARATADDRDGLMILLGADAGLRCCEICKVHTRDVWQDVDGWTLRIVGKGGKVRDVPLTKRLALLLRSQPPGYVFPGQDRGHLSPAYVSKRLSRALGDGVTAHQLRHRFASRAYAVERDIRAVQELLGHSSPETTARYTQVPDDARRRAVLAAEVA